MDDEDAVADTLDDIEDVRAIEDCLAGGSSGREQVFDQDGGIDIETGEGFIEKDDVRVVEQGGGDEDFLPHAFGISIEADYAVAGQAEGIEDIADSGLQCVFFDVVEAAGEFEEFLPGEAIE